MDFTVILQSLWQNLWFLVPLFVLVAILKSARFKGWVGEAIVNLSALIFLDRKTYRLIRNVTLLTEDGTTQIDHIIVSPFGVFVVETKNMKGWIFGGGNQRYWTQKIFRYSQKFQNPLHQNYKHVKTLQALLGLSDQLMHSLVVFVGDSTFKTPMPPNVTEGVVGYLRYIKSQTQTLLTPEQVSQVVEKIENGRLKACFRTHRDHGRHVQGIVERKQANMGLFAEQDDRHFVQKQRHRNRWVLKPLVIAGLLVFSVFYLTNGDEPVADKREPSVEVAQSKVQEQQIALAREQQAREETLSLVREAQERARLAALKKAREWEFERVFDQNYVVPEGCDNWRSNRHMVECVNHRMRARSEFHESYFGAGNAKSEG